MSKITAEQIMLGQKFVYLSHGWTLTRMKDDGEGLLKVMNEHGQQFLIGRESEADPVFDDATTLSKDQKREFIHRHYNQKARAWFVDKLKIGTGTYDTIVAELMSDGLIEGKVVHGTYSVEMKKKLCRAYWEFKRGLTTKSGAEVAEQFGLKRFDRISDIAKRYLKTRGMTLTEYVKQPTYELIDVAEMPELELSDAGKLLCSKWDAKTVKSIVCRN